MIRFFGLLKRLDFLKITAYDLYNMFKSRFNPSKFPCPYCQTKHPGWKQHATYLRYLLSFENGKSVTYTLTIIRYKCSSCKHTHAVLPEIIIPYRSYSIILILLVMKDYYTKSLTIEKICEKYDISVSTLYSWKALFLKHKKIWLGLLEDACMLAVEFLESFFHKHIKVLREFYITAGVSFLQNQSCIEKAHSPPA